MKALVYHGPGTKAWEEVADPVVIDGTDAIVRVDATTICGTDLHIMKGDVPAVIDGRILGHEAVGTVEAVGSETMTMTSSRRAGLPGARPPCGSVLANSSKPAAPVGEAHPTGPIAPARSTLRAHPVGREAHGLRNPRSAAGQGRL